VIACADHACQNVLELRIVADQPQQRFAASSFFADAEQVFRRRIESDDQKRTIQQDDA